MFDYLKKLFGRQSVPPKASTNLHIKQELRAKVIKACGKCGSAGVDSAGTDVGPICPICGADRPPNEDKGIIWRRFKNAN